MALSLKNGETSPKTSELLSSPDRCEKEATRQVFGTDTCSACLLHLGLWWWSWSVAAILASDDLMHALRKIGLEPVIYNQPKYFLHQCQSIQSLESWAWSQSSIFLISRLSHITPTIYWVFTLCQALQIWTHPILTILGDGLRWVISILRAGVREIHCMPKVKQLITDTAKLKYSLSNSRVCFLATMLHKKVPKWHP